MAPQLGWYVWGRVIKASHVTALPDLKPLAGLELVDHAGLSVKLASAWQSGPAVLVFLRHYG